MNPQGRHGEDTFADTSTIAPGATRAVWPLYYNQKHAQCSSFAVQQSQDRAREAPTLSANVVAHLLRIDLLLSIAEPPVFILVVATPTPSLPFALGCCWLRSEVGARRS